MSSYLSQSENVQTSSNKGKAFAIGAAALAVCGLAYHQTSTATNSLLAFQTQEASNLNADLMAGNLVDKYISIESYNVPDNFIRLREETYYQEVWIDQNDGSDEFAQDATWKVKDGNCGKRDHYSFESIVFMRQYLMHYGLIPYVRHMNPWDRPNMTNDWNNYFCFRFEWSDTNEELRIWGQEGWHQAGYTLQDKGANTRPGMVFGGADRRDQRWIVRPGLVSDPRAGW